MASICCVSTFSGHARTKAPVLKCISVSLLQVRQVNNPSSISSSFVFWHRGQSLHPAFFPVAIAQCKASSIFVWHDSSYNHLRSQFILWALNFGSPISLYHATLHLLCTTLH